MGGFSLMPSNPRYLEVGSSRCTLGNWVAGALRGQAGGNEWSS